MSGGYIDAFLYAFFTAISFNFIDKLDNEINPNLALLVMSIIATVFFNIVGYKKIKHTYVSCFNSKVIFVCMSLSIGVNWVCSIFGPHVSDPFIYLSLNFIIQSMLGFICVKKNDTFDFFNHYLCALILAVVVVLTYIYYEPRPGENMLLGVFLGVLSGVGGYLYSHYSNKLAVTRSLNSIQILAVRYWILIIILLSFILKEHDACKIDMRWHSMFNVIIMAFLVLVLPVYFNQNAIQKLGVSKRSVIVSITPVITFIMFSIAMRDLNYINLLIAIGITLTLLIAKVLSYILRRLHYYF